MMSKLSQLVAEAQPRITEISNYLYWKDLQAAGNSIEARFYEGGPVCLVPVFPDGHYGHTTIKDRYTERPYWRS
jgi:hypothetical protein